MHFFEAAVDKMGLGPAAGPKGWDDRRARGAEAGEGANHGAGPPELEPGPVARAAQEEALDLLVEVDEVNGLHARGVAREPPVHEHGAACRTTPTTAHTHINVAAADKITVYLCTYPSKKKRGTGDEGGRR